MASGFSAITPVCTPHRLRQHFAESPRYRSPRQVSGIPSQVLERYALQGMCGRTGSNVLFTSSASAARV